VLLTRPELEALMAPGDRLAISLAELLQRPAWMADAACRGMPAEIFFIEPGGNAEPARAVCASCPTRQPCLAYALSENMPGIWAGTTPRQRAALRRKAS
jgi:WhiB family redox-sensing transcriptional regulator